MSRDSDGKVKILDCTLRDGGHLNQWRFSTDFAGDCFRAIDSSGVDIIEVGYRSSQGTFPDAGEFRFTPDSLIEQIVGQNPNARIAVMADVGKITADDFAPRDETNIDLVRLAFYKKDLDEALRMADAVHELGYEVGLNMMGISEYSPGDLQRAGSRLGESPAAMLYIADSFGSAYPNDVADLVSGLHASTGKPIGFHAHNNMQLAFANALAAVEAGAEYIDVTLNGLGRGPGNLHTEVWLEHQNRRSGGRHDTSGLLEFVDTQMGDLSEQGIDEWGYHPRFLLTGGMSVHPNYASRLADQGYSLAETQQILGLLDTDARMGFDQDRLGAAIEAFKTDSD